MNSCFHDPGSRSWTLPARFANDDVRLSEDVLERYISRFTEPGELVFDPFAGFGTTLVVAERMGRAGLGCEFLPERAAYANSLLRSGEVRAGDIRSAGFAGISARLVISSPPYMNRNDPEDPLQAYGTPVGSYDGYIHELADIYVALDKCLAPDGRMVIQLQNLANGSVITPLAFDLVAAIGGRLEFLGEEICLWRKESYGYSHGYCLIYRSTDS